MEGSKRGVRRIPNTTTNPVATDTSAKANAVASASSSHPPPPPPAVSAPPRPRAGALLGLSRLLLLLLSTRQRHHGTSAPVEPTSKTPTANSINASRMRVRYRDSTPRVESPSFLVLPPPSLPLRMTASIAAASLQLFTARQVPTIRVHASGWPALRIKTQTFIAGGTSSFSKSQVLRRSRVPTIGLSCAGQVPSAGRPLEVIVRHRHNAIVIRLHPHVETLPAMTPFVSPP